MEGNGFRLLLPEEEQGLDQDEEFCILDFGDRKKHLRFHDYHEIYKVEGLYEHLFYDVLKCDSPRTICEKLVQVAESSDIPPADLNVLDVGAGNGMVGEELRSIGVGSVIGIDIIPEAKEALLRDRPQVYDGYMVEDLTSLDDKAKRDLAGQDLNCMTIVAALGFGDIPPLAFSEGFNLISDSGVIAFNIRDKFIETDSSSDFSSLIETMEKENIFEVHVKEKYRHRVDISGNPIYYYAIAGIKTKDIPPGMLEQLA